MIELLPISKNKIQKFLINAELCKLKNKLLYNLEKLQKKLSNSYYRVRKKNIFLLKENSIYYINFINLKKNTFENIFQFKNNLYFNQLYKNNQKLLNIFAPIKKILNQFKLKKFFYDTFSRFKSNKILVSFQNFEIVKYYRQIVQFLLNYYIFAKNSNDVKIIISQLKLSCIYTLAYKHNKTAH